MPNPNPSPETRFGAKNGNPINLAGKTSEQRENEYQAAEKAAKLRNMAHSLMLEKVESGEMDVLEVLDANALKLFKDSEDRAHGTPKATTEMSGADGGGIPMTLTVATKIIDAD